MLAAKSIQWRRRYHTAAACRKILWAGTRSRSIRSPTLHQRDVNASAANRGEAATSSRCYSYSNYRLPSVFSSVDIGEERFCRRRSFSKFAPDEFVAKNNSAAATSIAVAKHPSSMFSEAPQIAQPQNNLAEENVEHASHKNANNKLLTDLHEAHELFHQIYTEAKALIRNNKSSTTSEEVVAMADYFMILVNSLDLEKSLEIVQSLQTVHLHEKNQKENILQDKNNKARQIEGGEEGLRQAVKSMSQLHHVFLNMVESALPLNPPILSKDIDEQFNQGDDGVAGVPRFDKNMYSALTVGRALQLSRRAVELGLPMHRPLYQRLATGLVLTSSPPVLPPIIPEPPLPSAEYPTQSKSIRPTDVEPPSLILPEQYQQVKEDVHTPPLVTKLLGIHQHARLALKISLADQSHQLALELFTDPLLLLLKEKRWEEAMGLLHGWRAQSGNGEKIDLLGLLGEKNILDSLELSKGWLENGSEFQENVESNAHAMELTKLLEVAVAEILKGQKQREEQLSHLLWHLSLHGNDDDGDFDENDSDSDFEDDFDYGSDGDDELEASAPAPLPAEFGTESNFTPFDSPAVRAQSDPQHEITWHDKDTATLSYRVDDSNTFSKRDNGQEKDAGDSTIINGLSDKEARKSIYLRNGVDWVLPDIVPTLEEWNKGNQLTFTPEFERYLGWQIMKEGNEDDED